MAIATRLILVSSVLLWGLLALADVNSDSTEQFVSHLNHYYTDLNLKVAKPAAAATIEDELSTLELVLGQQVPAYSAQLMHLACNSPACCGGGCCGSVCDRTTSDDQQP